MKRGTPDHPKTKRLARLLGIEISWALGILEGLSHFTSRHAIRGDIGKWSNEEIADGINWGGDPNQLVSALVDAGWFDVSDHHRLVVHDWHDHADDSVRKTLKNRGERFATITEDDDSFPESSGKVAKVPEDSGNGSPQPEPSLSLAKPEPSHSHTVVSTTVAKTAAKRCVFASPTVEEVAAYCQERKNAIDPEEFVAYYSARGWKLSNGPMKNWRAAVITWEKRNRDKPATTPERQPRYLN